MDDLKYYSRQIFKKSRALIHFSILSLLLFVSGVQAGVNILVVGSTEGFDKREQPNGHDDHLSLPKLTQSLETILNKGKTASGKTSVTLDDVHRKKMVTVAQGSKGVKIETEFHCHSLAQYYFWPDGRDQRLASLANDGETKWDYIVLVGDPYLISEMPGIYAEGIYLLTERIKDGGAKVVLLMPWHSDKAKNDRISEVVNRVGQLFELPVAPAGAAWEKGGKAGDKEYLAATSIFSALSEKEAWSSSPGEKRMAKLAFDSMKENSVKKTHSGTFDLLNPFAFRRFNKNTITFNQTGSSSEAGIKRAIIDGLRRLDITPQEVDGSAAHIDFNYGRGNSNFEPEKRYQVNSDKFGSSFGFPMQEQVATAAESMLYGIDKRYFDGVNYDDGTDLGIAYDMIRDGEVKHGVRCIPIRLLWAKLKDANPNLTPLGDRWHMSKYLDAASGTFLVTILTGRSPVGDEPAQKDSDAWNLWLGRKLGYETAMRLSFQE